MNPHISAHVHNATYYQFRTQYVKTCIEAAITGYVRSGATIKQIQRITGLSALDIEQVIIDKKLSVKP